MSSDSMAGLLAGAPGQTIRIPELLAAYYPRASILLACAVHPVVPPPAPGARALSALPALPVTRGLARARNRAIAWRRRCGGCGLGVTTRPPACGGRVGHGADLQP